MSMGVLHKYIVVKAYGNLYSISKLLVIYSMRLPHFGARDRKEGVAILKEMPVGCNDYSL
ncbi:MAG: hypothetical protein BMS9Abin25_1467 [Gammaproteobacteria bacterium]|nr:MAG: hypothetical protein BMS9Abin25_1467 [Gammaproteobacteria bacterium]